MFSGKHADKIRQLIHKEQTLLFETVDLSWLTDDYTQDIAGKRDENGGEDRVKECQHLSVTVSINTATHSASEVTVSHVAVSSHHPQQHSVTQQ